MTTDTLNTLDVMRGNYLRALDAFRRDHGIHPSAKTCLAASARSYVRELCRAAGVRPSDGTMADLAREHEEQDSLLGVPYSSVRCESDRLAEATGSLHERIRAEIGGAL